jgi:hypothetical protein
MEMRRARLPRHQHGLDAGGQHDLRRFGIGVNVELGRRRAVAAAIDRAAHDGEPADAAHDARRRRERHREIGERADEQQVDQPAGGRGDAELADQETGTVRSGDLGDGVRPGRAAQPIVAVDLAGVDDDLFLQRLGRALVHLDVGAGDCQHRQDVIRRRLEIDVAEHRGDGIGRPAVGDQQQQRLGIVDPAVGIEDQFVGQGRPLPLGARHSSGASCLIMRRRVTGVTAPKQKTNPGLRP